MPFRHEDGTVNKVNLAGRIGAGLAGLAIIYFAYDAVTPDPEEVVTAAASTNWLERYQDEFMIPVDKDEVGTCTFLQTPFMYTKGMDLGDGFLRAYSDANPSYFPDKGHPKGELVLTASTGQQLVIDGFGDPTTPLVPGNPESIGLFNGAFCPIPETIPSPEPTSTESTPVPTETAPSLPPTTQPVPTETATTAPAPTEPMPTKTKKNGEIVTKTPKPKKTDGS